METGEEAGAVAQKIVASVSNPVQLGGYQAHIGASIGIAVFPDDGDNYGAITQYADVAMYQAKESGRGTYRFFEPGMNAKAEKRAKIDAKFRHGLKNNEFFMHYQPKLGVASGRIVSMESLVRWRQSDGALVSPLDFIPHAKETGLIIPLGRDILRMACGYNKNLLDAGMAPLSVAVNLSARQFQDKALYSSIRESLEETGLPPELLELEVTESMYCDELQGYWISRPLEANAFTRFLTEWV